MNPDCSMVCSFSLVSDKQYSVNTHLGDFKYIIKGTFNRYERNKSNSMHGTKIIRYCFEKIS